MTDTNAMHGLIHNLVIENFYSGNLTVPIAMTREQRDMVIAALRVLRVIFTPVKDADVYVYEFNGEPWVTTSWERMELPDGTFDDDCGLSWHAPLDEVEAELGCPVTDDQAIVTASKRRQCWCIVHGPDCRSASTDELDRLRAENERLKRALHRETTMLRDMGAL